MQVGELGGVQLWGTQAPSRFTQRRGAGRRMESLRPSNLCLWLVVKLLCCRQDGSRCFACTAATHWAGEA